MMTRNNITLYSCLLLTALLLTARLHAQQVPAERIGYVQLVQLASGATPKAHKYDPALQYRLEISAHQKNPTSKYIESCVKLPVHSAKDLPAFCRIEHQVALKLPVKVKFRLGSVDYVDWLEGYRDGY